MVNPSLSLLFVSLKTDTAVSFSSHLLLGQHLGYLSSGWAVSVSGAELLWPCCRAAVHQWVSAKDIWVRRPLPSVQSRRLTEEINEAQLCKIGVKYVQLWLHIYQTALLDFPLNSIHYQNGLQKLFIKNKLMLINSNCSDH